MQLFVKRIAKRNSVKSFRLSFDSIISKTIRHCPQYIYNKHAYLFMAWLKRLLIVETVQNIRVTVTDGSINGKLKSRSVSTVLR